MACEPLLGETEHRKMKALSFEVRLALGRTELELGRPEGRWRLQKLEQEAREWEFFRVVRLSREALERRPQPPGQAPER